MTTATIRHRHDGNGGAVLALILIALAALAFGVLMIQVQTRQHAIAKHGLDAAMTRYGCDNFGPDEVLRSRSWKTPNKFFQLCPLEDGRYGLRIIACRAGRWIEVTSFVVKGGSWEETWEYVSGKGTRFSGRLSEVCQ